MRNRLTAITAAFVIGAVGFLAGSLVPRHNQPAPVLRQVSSVATYNDGFATAKQDDCQQGSTAACRWLHTGR